MIHEGQPLPFCLRDRDVDCPHNCPLNPTATEVVEDLAKAQGVSFEEVIANSRSASDEEKAVQRSLDRGVMDFVGNSDRCLLKEAT